MSTETGTRRWDDGRRDSPSRVSRRWSRRNEDRPDGRLRPSARTEARRLQARRVDSRRGLLATPGPSLGPTPGTQRCSILARPRGHLALTSPLRFWPRFLFIVSAFSQVSISSFPSPTWRVAPDSSAGDCGRSSLLQSTPRASGWRRGLKSQPLRVSRPEPDALPPRTSLRRGSRVNARVGGEARAASWVGVR